MTTTYTIKPLVWEDDDKYQKGFARGWVDYYVVWIDQNAQWSAVFALDYRQHKCDSLAHGKQLCQQHWESEAGVGKYLEIVGTK